MLDAFSVMNRYKNIIFDFDGVIVDSNQIRLDGFIKLYRGREIPKKGYCTESEIALFRRYLYKSHGLSRYEKIRCFYNTILGGEISEGDLQREGAFYSEIVLDDMLSAKYVSGAIGFLEKCHLRSRCMLISSSDESELQLICDKRNLSRFFEKVAGSPTLKVVNMKNVIDDFSLVRNQTVYIGDAVSDFKSATEAGIDFIGFCTKNFSGVADVLTVNTYSQLESILYC